MSKQTHNPKLTYTRVEIQKLLNCGRRTVERLEAEGKLRPILNGRSRPMRYPASDVLALAESVES